MNYEEDFWQPIYQYEELYEINPYGKIRKISQPNRLLSQYRNQSGKLVVDLYKDRKRQTKIVADLVAETFVSKRVGNNIVNHKDGDKDNNYYKNLEWTKRQCNGYIGKINKSLYATDYIYASDKTYHYYKSEDLIKVQIDVEDLEKCQKHGWYISRKGYVYTLINNHPVQLHRYIMDVTDKNITVDHDDGNKLNNKRENLILMNSLSNLLKSWHVQKQREHMKTPVVMINPSTKETINRFNSASEAAYYLMKKGLSRIFNQGAISNVCRGIRRTASGFEWRWA